ncbi:hypothetical protein BUZ59_09770 [Staphylococcus kloosii]|uniref:Uncharacterized protein n=1 Tax=Staphylococcus kloosii TaxID=29384 RepID=A0A151A5A4_9STAP|nr:hypothetical protein C7J89_08185 [Staphylococcus kloosii]KYH14415.1 hypothetical protein A0131_06455 [Staphylococcus kloosii]PNZ04518.1 hypothetical protein CD136_08960 [Staphylococcus kloosii]PTJ75434.1 hypothetical protein BUZ59_09770 [Staphylococcus kloosii]
MKKHYIFKGNGYFYPFVMSFFMLYLFLISFYIINYSLKLKTLSNINDYYDNQIQRQLVEEE